MPDADDAALGMPVVEHHTLSLSGLRRFQEPYAGDPPTHVALPLSDAAQQARDAKLRHMFVTFREFVLTQEWDDSDFDAAVRVANGILGLGAA